MNQKYFIGVDISKSKLDVAVIDGEYQIILEKVIPNKPAKIHTFLKSLCRKLKVSSDELLVCCENTGIYGRPLEKICSASEFVLWKENAFKIKKASSDIRGKSDQKDAMRIADYALRYRDRVIAFQEPDPQCAKMKSLMQVRDSLMAQSRVMKNQLSETKSHAPELYRELSRYFLPALKTLKVQLERVEEELKQLVESNEAFNKNLALLTSIPGIGRQNALQFIAQTDNFTRFESAKHLACYAGVVPFPYQSGTMIRKDRVSHFANRKLKTLIHLAAMSATRIKGEFQTYYIRKVKEGKNKMAVINAIRNKLIHRMFSIIIRQTPYIKLTTNESIKIDSSVFA